LLGLGHVGSAIAALALARPAALERTVSITCALVRDPGARVRQPGVPLTTNPRDVFEGGPEVIVEVIGGLDPARSLVLEALDRRIPVVTANKSLLARHGNELLTAARQAGVPLRYEASVIAGVPFLDTLARRPLASSLSSLSGILNGTSNYILSEMERGSDYRAALAEAQRRGFAEPDPSKDVEGIDALEKLTILLRQFTASDVSPDAIEVTGITRVSREDLVHARELGGVIKPVVHASWSGHEIDAFAGPAWVPRTHPLASLSGPTNGMRLCDGAGTALCFTGPGAGPRVTAITVLDDVIEATRGGWAPSPATGRARVSAPATRWLVRARGREPRPDVTSFGDRLASCGVGIERVSVGDACGRGTAWLLTHPCSRDRVEAAASTLAAAAGCDAFVLRTLEP
jgi:homoserine dehydrogenase